MKHGFLSPPVQVKEMVRNVDLEAYRDARASGDTSEYWRKHQYALQWCHGRYFEGRTDYWPGLENEFFFEVSNALRQVFENTLRPMIPFEEKTESGKIKIGKAIAVYYADEHGKLENDDELLFNSLNFRSMPKTVVIDDSKKFSENYRDDTSLRLYIEDLKTLYSNRLLVVRNVDGKEKYYEVPIEKSAETHLKSEDGMPIFFGKYRIDQVAKVMPKSKPMSAPISTAETSDEISRKICDEDRKETPAKEELITA